MLTFLGILISASCAYASLRRLWLAADATALDSGELASALRATSERRAAWPMIRREIEREPGADWESELIEAIAAPAVARTALVNEQLAELDYRAQRWGRVPRVCASISSTSGFLLASLAMRAGLASEDMDISAAVLAAINVVTIGLAGTAFCVAAHVRARAMTRARLAATDALVDRLETLASEGDGTAAPGLPSAG